MNILFLALDTKIDGRAGDTVHVVELAGALRDLGHEIILMVGSGIPDHRLHNVKVVTIEKRFTGIGRFLDDVCTIIAAILESCAGFKPHAIYERRFSCKIGWVLQCLFGAPLVVEINGLIDEETAAAKRKFVHLLSPGLLLRQARAVVAVSPGLRTKLIDQAGLDPAKVFAVSNGVDPRRFFPQSQATARRAFSLSEAGPYLCYVGNLVGWYDFNTLLLTVRELTVDYPSIQLLIAGEGDLESDIRREIARLQLMNNVQMLGYVPHVDVPRFIATSDVCVAPLTYERNSNIELSPLKLFEYLACARPVVSSMIGGLDRYLSVLPALRLATVGQPASLTSEIKAALADCDEVACLRSAEYVKRNFSWAQTAKSITAILERRV